MKCLTFLVTRSLSRTSCSTRPGVPTMMCGHSAVEDLDLHVGQVAAEALKLVVDLEGQLARVAQHDGADLPLLGLELVQRREHEDGRLAHTGLGLADDVHAQDGLRDALVLHLGRVLEAAVDNRAQQLGLEQEVAEARRVDAGVGAPLLDLVSRLVVNDLVLLVVDQILVSELLSHLG